MATLRAVTISSKTNHVGTVVPPGSTNVFVNNIATVRQTATDQVSCPISGHNTPLIATGSSKVFVNQKAMVRENDTVASPCGGFFNTLLSSNVFIG